MKTRHFLVFLAVTFLLFPVVASANHSWGNYHWARQSNPFTLKVGDNVSSTWDGHLSVASGDWSQSTVLNTTVVAGGARNKNCRPTSGRIEVCNGTYGFNGWLGIAQIWASGSHITQAVTKVNDSYFNTPSYNSPAWRQFVMCQEVGHDFGLDHQDENFDNANLGTCMDYTSDPSSNQHPNRHDYDQLETIYAHLDSTTTVQQIFEEMADAFSMPPVLDDSFDGPEEWGRLIEVSADGYTAIFERNLGGGNRVLTFVTWAHQGLEPPAHEGRPQR